MTPVALLHNWAQPVREVFEFRTNVFVAQDGTEQRRAERVLPRRSLELSLLTSGDSFRSFEQFVHTRDETSIVVPDYGKALLGAAYVNTFTLSVTSLPAWLVTGAPVCVFNESRIYTTTVQDVQTFTPTGLLFSTTLPLTWHITLAAQIPNDMTGGFLYLLPQATAHIDPKINYASSTDEAAIFTVPMMIDPGTETLDAITEGASALPLFDGRELFVTSPNYAQPPQVTMNANFDMVDYNRGVRGFFRPIAFPTTVTQAGFLGRRASDIRDIVGLFCRMRGRQGEFFAPGWLGDLRQSGGILSGAAYLRVNGTYAADPVNVGVLIELNDGTHLAYKVTGYVASSNTDARYPVPSAFQAGFSDAFGFPQYGLDPVQTVLLLDGAPTKDILYTDIARVSWLRLTRFATDSLTVLWQNDDVATCQVSTQSLKYAAAETV